MSLNDWRSVARIEIIKLMERRLSIMCQYLKKKYSEHLCPKKFFVSKNFHSSFFLNFYLSLFLTGLQLRIGIRRKTILSNVNVKKKILILLKKNYY